MKCFFSVLEITSVAVCKFKVPKLWSATMSILNVAEKNDAAKNISNILSRGTFNRREGFSKFNKIYEFSFNFNGLSTNMIMTSVSGHLLNFAFSPAYKSWHSINPVELFDASIDKVLVSSGEAIKRTLQREVRNCRKLIIWTDCDREGENICFEIVQVCQQAEPNIEILRARFSEITPTAIHRAINQLTVPDNRVSAAVDARQELDLRIGAAFTRFQTLRLRRVFPRALNDRLISYGSCQFPTLGFVVQRFREVDRFVPEPFWRIVVTVEQDGRPVDFQWKRGRLFDQDCSRAYYQHLLENRYGQVIEVTKRPKSKWRPVAMNTVELEKLASRKLRLGAKTTMQLAERLYNQGFISYPRTETNIFPKGIDLKTLVALQAQDSRWSAFATNLSHRGPNPRNGKSTDSAHPPIHPLKAGTALQGDEARLYELITRHFLACLSADAQGAETVVRIRVGKSTAYTHTANITMVETGEIFEAKGLMVLMPNYLEVYTYDRWTEHDIPNFQLNDWVVPTNIEIISGQTSPPALLTEADLIALMDKHGIGTDATHAEHIETIKQRLYVGLEEQKFLVPSQLGMGLVDGYDAMGLDMSKPCLRAEFEADLRLICDGHKSKEEVLHHHISKYRQLFKLTVSRAQQLDQALSKCLDQFAEDVRGVSGSIGETSSLVNECNTKRIAHCPFCSSHVILRRKRTAEVRPVNENQTENITSRSLSDTNCGGWFLSCTGYPRCRYAVWFPDSVCYVRPVEPNTESNADVTCQHCSHLPNPPVKLALRLRHNMQLPSGYRQDGATNEYITCIFCDDDLRQALNIRLPITNTQLSNNGSPEVQLTQFTIQPNQLHSTPTDAFFSVQPVNHSRHSISCTPAVTTNPSFVIEPNQPSSERFSGRWQQPQNGESVIETDDVVLCHCGVQAIVLTVKKMGPNHGRLFYKCGAGTENSCDFFLWKTHSSTDGSSTASNTPNLSSTNPSRSSIPSFPANSYSFGRPNLPEPPLCRCGDQAKLLRVNRSTPNQGREFFACPNSRPPTDGSGASEGCNFFLWADNSMGHSSSENSSTNEDCFGGRGRYVRMDRRYNKDRSNPVDLSDSGVSLGHVPIWPPPASGGFRGGGSSRRTNRTRNSMVAVRRCRLCGEPGHTRNRCPRSTNSS